MIKLFKTILLINALFLLNENTIAQEIDEKYTHYFKDVTGFKNSDIQVEIKNIASRYNYFKFAFKLKNTSKDYLIYDNSKSKLVFDWGEVHLKKTKIYFLKPKKSESEVFDVNDDIRFLKKEVKFVIDGLVKVPAKGKVQKITNTQIDNKINVKLNNIAVSFNKIEIKLKKSVIQLKIVNKSKDYVIITPSQLKVKVSEDLVLNNNVSENKRILLKPGKSKVISFSFDLLENQSYFDYKDKTVLFNAFLEIVTPIELDPIEFEFELDREVTYKMNK